MRVLTIGTIDVLRHTLEDDTTITYRTNDSFSLHTSIVDVVVLNDRVVEISLHKDGITTKLSENVVFNVDILSVLNVKNSRRSDGDITTGRNVEFIHVGGGCVLELNTYSILLFFFFIPEMVISRTGAPERPRI